MLWYQFSHMCKFTPISDLYYTFVNLLRVTEMGLSTLTYKWTPLEEQVANTIESQHICGRFRLATKFLPISESTS